MVKKTSRNQNNLEKISVQFTNWVGTPTSILVHSLFFIGIFGLKFFGWGIDQILLILTTAVSLEAIYLAIFIQMTVNRNTQSLEEVEEDIDEIQEDVEDLQEDVEDIQEEDVKDLKTKDSLGKIEIGLQKLLNEVENLKERNSGRNL